MKVVLSEKPSVAREIALQLGATEKKNGYITGNGYCVTWALGHLVALGMPEDYGIRGFQREALPILPAPFLLTVRKIAKDKSYDTDPTAKKQLDVIASLFARCDSIIVATDAGREGELIFRYIYYYLKCEKPFERLWISSLTEKAIKEGFSSLKPGPAFDRLYDAALARSRADWLVGINASQALTIAAGQRAYSLGRVQTPTLALVCKRFLNHRNFSSQAYWQVQLAHRKDFIDFKTLSTDKYNDKHTAEGILKDVERNGSATVVEAVTKTVTEQPPLLFDLTGLQKVANKQLGLSADETLKIAQTLYEQKYITYPRTGSRHIPEDVWATIPGLVRAMESRQTLTAAVGKVKWGHFNRRIVNDLKVTDHHGLLITERIPSALTAEGNAIYDMIALRLVEAVCQVCIKEMTDVVLNVAEISFSVKGGKVLDPGWRAIQGMVTDPDAEPFHELPSFEVGDQLKIKSAVVLEKKTKAPALFTEATLLGTMESAGRAVEDEREREAMRQTGLGTPATRAAIIETLIARSYIQRQKKALVPTEKGLQVYELVKDKRIADVAMTATWEVALQAIEHGVGSAATFQQQIENYATSITAELLSLSLKPVAGPILRCPKCQSAQLNISDKVVKCTDPACGWVLFLKICGVTLPVAEIKNLVTTRKTSLIKAMKGKSGKLFDAYLILDDQMKTSFQFPAKK